MSIISKLDQQAQKNGSLLCVGLDSNINRLPKRFLKEEHPQFEFNKWIIEQTHQYVCAYKPNLAFYEARGAAGWNELTMTTKHLRQNHPDIFLIADAKRADIGSTNEGYVTAILDELGFDAITLSPYLGREALEPFLERQDKACIILCRTSNPGAGEFQDLEAEGKPIWLHVAEKVVGDWNKHDNCMLVVGATYPKELEQVRQTVGEMWLLVPGVGAQGGDLEAVLKVGLNSQDRGLVINSSRGIIFADDPREEAKKLFEAIKK